MSEKIVTVIIDRPLGSVHPKHPNIVYPVNYGYIAGTVAGDGEEEDVYILGVDHPVSTFTGQLIAKLHRQADVEDTWVAAPRGMTFTEDEIRAAVHFQEQYFHTDIRLL